LKKKKRELEGSTDLGASLQLDAAPPQPWQQKAISAPLTATGVQLTGNTVVDLLTIARGQNKLPVPPWPKFNDSYRSYYTFKEELTAYIKDYAQGVSKRSLAVQIKRHCLTRRICGLS
jgi:hypothetical protein